jgi:hypothetical protein
MFDESNGKANKRFAAESKAQAEIFLAPTSSTRPCGLVDCNTD